MPVADCKQSCCECDRHVSIYVQNLSLILSCIILMLTIHPPACRQGDTPLKWAMDFDKSDVVALLRSVGAAE